MSCFSFNPLISCRLCICMLVIYILALLVIYYVWEYQKHQSLIKQIPIRIHVNGTRGKSSVTRLIYAGLKEGKIKVIAKTTGSQARLISEQGEIPIPRLHNKANIIEQLWVVQQAVQQKAQALVVECMALQPELQSLSELKIIQSTHGVLTNIREDHLDVMGPTERDVGLALLGTVPKSAVLISAELDYQSMIESCAKDRNTSYISVTHEDIAQIDQGILDRFPYQEHASNIALALLVCENMGVPREVALTGMIQSPPDIGVLKSFKYIHPHDQRELEFISAFAANDPESTGLIWENQQKRKSDQTSTMILINCRADRIDRTIQLAQASQKWTKADYYIALGIGGLRFKEILIDLGMITEQEIWVEENECVLMTLIDHVFERIKSKKLMLLGIGNIKGIGLELIDFFEHQKEI